MSGDSLDALARELCRVFLGWRLREDYDALLALEEGALRVDLLSGEAWCDADPLPPLFIAGALRAELEQGVAAVGRALADLQLARLDAVFHRRDAFRAGRPIPRLEIACRVSLALDGVRASADANNALELADAGAPGQRRRD